MNHNQDVVSAYQEAVELANQAQNSNSPGQKAKLAGEANRRLMMVIENMAIYSATLGNIALAFRAEGTLPRHHRLAAMMDEFMPTYESECSLAATLEQRARREICAELDTDEAGLSKIAKALCPGLTGERSSRN